MCVHIEKTYPGIAGQRPGQVLRRRRQQPVAFVVLFLHVGFHVQTHTQANAGILTRATYLPRENEPTDEFPRFSKEITEDKNGKGK